MSVENAAQLDWAKEIQGAVTVCDRDGIILYMNDKALKNYQKNPEENLVGKNLFDCHNQRSVAILKKMMQEETSNYYTVEKKGIKKFIAQLPWRQGGRCMGIVEIGFEVPGEMPHYVR